jgi:hypothetical protein
LRDLPTVHGIAFVAQKSAIPVRTAPKPPPNFAFFQHLHHLHDNFRRLLQAIQIEANLAETADKT